MPAMSAPLQMVWESGVTVAVDEGFTITVLVTAAPVQVPFVGVMVNNTGIAALVALLSEPVISPVPLLAMPVMLPVSFLTQE